MKGISLSPVGETAARVDITHLEADPCSRCGSVRFVTSMIVDGWLDYTSTTSCTLCGLVLRVEGVRPESAWADEPAPVMLTEAGLRVTASSVAV